MAEATEAPGMRPRIMDDPKPPKPKGRDLGPAGYPTKVEVVLVHKQTGEERKYQQTELAIDGEAQLMGLIERAASFLMERDFPWDTLSKLFSPEGQAQLNPEQLGPDAVKVLSIVATAVPDLVIDSTCVFFGIFEFDEDGKRNEEWLAERKFIRRAVGFVQWVDLVRTFISQNDYQRLAEPFGQAFAAGALAQRRSAEETAS